jgi:hypothetical protein
MSNISLNQGTWKRITILVGSIAITILREEADVVTLGADDDSKLDLWNINICRDQPL